MLTLVRDIVNDNEVMGRLELNGQFICYTAENPAKAIPTGFYKLQN